MAGQKVLGINADGEVVCAEDANTPTIYTGADFATSDQSCPNGQVIRGINDAGEVICVADANTQNTYDGTNFATSGQTCLAGQKVLGINADGEVVCTDDIDTQNTYDGSNFATSGQTCLADRRSSASTPMVRSSAPPISIPRTPMMAPTSPPVVRRYLLGRTNFAKVLGLTASTPWAGHPRHGEVVCAEDANTPSIYTGADFATSGQTCLAGQKVLGINADGEVVCAEDANTPSVYTGADFATSDQNCGLHRRAGIDRYPEHL